MWYIAFREDALDADGKIVRIRRKVRVGSAKEFSRREAQRIADEQILSLVNSQAVQPASLLTVKQFVDSSFRPQHVWALKHAGKLHYKYFLDKHVLPALGEMRLRDVTSEQVQALIRLKVESGLSVQTARHIRNVISAVFNHAKRRKAFHGDNPAWGVRMPEMQRKERHALGFTQASALVEALSTPAKEMVLLSIVTGLNVAELLGLTWKWVNLTDGSGTVGGEELPARTLGVRQNFYRGSFGSVKAKTRRRNVPLPPGVVAALQAMKVASSFNQPDHLVFCSGTGTPLDEKNIMRRVVKPVAAKLGMPWLGWHEFRHTHATLADVVGMAPTDRQAQLGHADYRMTMHYTHEDLKRRRQSIEAIESGVLGGGEETVGVNSAPK
jgi:integrase